MWYLFFSIVGVIFGFLQLCYLWFEVSSLHGDGKAKVLCSVDNMVHLPQTICPRPQK